MLNFFHTKYIPCGIHLSSFIQIATDSLISTQRSFISARDWHYRRQAFFFLKNTGSLRISLTRLITIGSVIRPSEFDCSI
ncbi:hypothetical protein CW304_21770 [Bacillus sp. UFRGS-B20]|nr:hypothetical protein CW304_21770 [Bacillus sp. UFRGS-B20]